MKTKPRVTILLPTTGDKGAVIIHAIETVLQQTIQEFELFIVGDGAGQNTIDTIQPYLQTDPRIRFFPFPKQVSRGTRNRHKLLIEKASGDVVCYLCDRDLWSRDHLELMIETLEHADFAYTQSLKVNRESVEFGPPLMDLQRLDHRKFFLSRIRQQQEFLPLSCVGHTMEMYRRLPVGWRKAIEIPTDYYMWLQFLENPECRVATTLCPTLTWFPTSEWGTEAGVKAEALARWRKTVLSDDWMRERWKVGFKHLYVRAASFRVKAALAEQTLLERIPARLAQWIYGIKS